MQKQAPAPGRIAVAILFSLSCFGLLLFLWVAFGGPVPLKSKSYRISADFPEAVTLAIESDVRIGGVSVGKVKSLELAPREPGDELERTRAELEIEPQYAPIASDAKAILRQKTLLGETYIELTSGSTPSSPSGGDDRGGPRLVSLGSAVEADGDLAERVETIPEGGLLAATQVTDATQIDEIFNALDAETRSSFQRWQHNAARAIRGRGLDLNDAIGNFGPFVSDAAEIVSLLRSRRPSVRSLIRDTGILFEAATERDSELAELIRAAEGAFGALASEEEALAETIAILPTFEDEARLTLRRLERFRTGAQPVVRDLVPVAHDVSPTLDSVRRLSPELRRLFAKLDPLIDAGRDGLPALQRTLAELRPVMEGLDPFLANLSPVVSTLRRYRSVLSDFLANAPSGIGAVVDPVPGQAAPIHTLRQLAYTSAETLSIAETRLDTNRGNGYLLPGALNSLQTVTSGIFPNFDCKNTDYPPSSVEPDPTEREFVFGDPEVGPGFAPCVIQPPASSIGLGDGRFQNTPRDP